MASRANGRKIDTWSFPCPAEGRLLRSVGRDQEQSLREPITVDVYLGSDRNGAPQFQFQSAKLPGIQETGTMLQGSDLAILRKEITDLAKEYWDTALGMEWEPYLEVGFGAGRSLNLSNWRSDSMRAPEDVAQGDSLRLTYARMWRGVMGGKAYTLSNNGGLIDFPESRGRVTGKDERPAESAKPAGYVGSSDDLVAALSRTDSREKDSQFVYIPDTTANRQSLDAILDAMNQLHARLESFLSPEAVQDNLQRLSSGVGLPQLLEGPGEPAAARGRKP